jgi:hypothetical protein
MADAVWTACSTPLFGGRTPPNQRGVIISTKAKGTGSMEVAVDPCFLPENPRKRKSCGGVLQGGHEGRQQLDVMFLKNMGSPCQVRTCVETIMRG